MVETLSGSYRPLPDLLRAVLERGGRGDLDEALAHFSRMPAYPDAAEALDTLRAAGVRVGVLSNSAEEAARAALVAAHWWDLLGAGRAGMRTAWVARKEGVLMPGVEVDWQGADLAGAAAAIAAG